MPSRTAPQGAANRRFVAIVGAPRSGTTWLQTLLASHDAVVSPQETNLFSRYVAPLEERWRFEARGTVEERRQRRFIGLGSVLTEEQFHEAVRRFVDDVVDHIGELRPGASVVVEKTPSHSLYVDAIARYIPGTRFVHIVRDGRDVAASLVAASQGWGAAWGAPNNVPAAARQWEEYVGAARRARDLGPYVELRYEALLGADASRVLRDVFEFCELDVSVDDAAARLDQYALDRQRAGERAIVIGGETARCDAGDREPEGFYRSGGAGGWAAWSTRERVEFDIEAGDLLRELAYETDAAWLGDARRARAARRSVATRRRLGRLEHAIGRRLVRSAQRLAP